MSPSGSSGPKSSSAVVPKEDLGLLLFFSLFFLIDDLVQVTQAAGQSTG